MEFPVTKAEKTQLMRAARTANLTMAEFLHELVFAEDSNGKLTIGGSVSDNRMLDALKKLTYEINSIGTNLNQITHIAHLIGVTTQTLEQVNLARVEILAKFAEVEMCIRNSTAKAVGF